MEARKRKWVAAFAAIAAYALAAAPGGRGEERGSQRPWYAVNLTSTLTPVAAKDLPAKDKLAAYTVYHTVFDRGGTRWHRWRVGLFPDDKEAKAALARLLAAYPSAWVVRVDEAEAQQVLATAPEQEAPGGLRVLDLSPPLPPRGNLAGPGVAKPDALERAREALRSGDYGRAAGLYERIIKAGGADAPAEAWEYLGVARERAGDEARAREAYQRYLALFPDGDGAERVKQRLTALLTARDEPTPALREPKSPAETGWEREGYVGFSQFYERDTSWDSDGAEVNRSAVATDLDLEGYVRKAGRELGAEFSGGYDRDFVDSDDTGSRISRLFVEGSLADRRAGLRLGRQSETGRGVFGRFDGGLGWFSLSERVWWNLVAGYPVDATSVSHPETERRFWGLSADLEGGAWGDWTVYFFDQRAEGLVDRRAVGAEVRKAGDRSSLFGLVDYDVSYRSLNLFLLSGTWRTQARTTFHASVDHRWSPFLTTSNALVGQEEDELGDLRDRLSEDEIRDLARDRTARSTSVSVGVSKPLTDRVQLNLDLLATKMGGTEDSAGVVGTDPTGPDYYATIQFIVNDLLAAGDLSLLGFRLADTESSRRYALDLNNRYPLGRAWRINPRLFLEHRDGKDGRGDQDRIRPQFRIHYRPDRRWTLELDAGAEWFREEWDGEPEITRGYFFSLGYRLDW